MLRRPLFAWYHVGHDANVSLLEVTLSDDRRDRIAVPADSSPEAEMEAIENAQGRYATGWATLIGGKRVRLEEIKAMRVLPAPK